jgi:hypothetical protein
MPEYTFICNDCDANFSIYASIAQYENLADSKKIICPNCQDTNVTRDYIGDCSTIVNSVKKSDSELKTLGDLADRNRDRMSNDQKEALKRKHNDYKLDKPDDPLPTGMSRIKKPPKIKWTKK